MGKEIKKITLLEGEGIHVHNLYGTDVQVVPENFESLSSNSLKAVIIKSSERMALIHEKPDGNPGEHKTIKMKPGLYIMGRQVEFNSAEEAYRQILD